VVAKNYTALIVPEITQISASHPQVVKTNQLWCNLSFLFAEYFIKKLVQANVHFFGAENRFFVEVQPQ
jgi:hypothetical protein